MHRTVLQLALTIAVGGCGGAAGGEGDAGQDGAAPLDSGPVTRWFEDVTDAVGAHFVHSPAEDYLTLPDRIYGGVCVLDVDGEAPLDLFFALRPSEGSGPRLLVASGALSYSDETSEYGLADVGDAGSCLAFDADGDGDDDLAIAGPGTLRLLLAEGGRFVDASERLGLSPDPRDMYTSMAAGDLDGDGDLDLVVGGFVSLHEDFRPPPESCASESCAASVSVWPPIPNLLLIQNGDGTFDDRAEELAPGLWELEPTLVVTVLDLNGDGHPDIYVGNDLGGEYPNRALVWDGAVFRDVSDEMGLGRNARRAGGCTMGLAHGDLDRNGTLDIVATSFELDPSSIFLCGADGRCDERGTELGTWDTARSFRWGTAVADFDRDGWLDVIEATGNLLTDEEGDRAGAAGPLRQPPNLLVGTGQGRLSVISSSSADGLATLRVSRGLALVDLDDDGSLDVVLAPSTGEAALLRNVVQRGHFLRVLLRGRAPNTAAVGARVEVSTADRLLVVQRTAGEGYLGNFDPRLHFGLASSDTVGVRVVWPDGTSQTYPDVPVDSELIAEQAGD